MFTIEQIRQAHSKVKSGADFPAYIKDLKMLGVTHYETFVKDGHTRYAGGNDYKIAATARYDDLFIAEQSDTESFKADLMAHQAGKTDFLTFCNECAETGIEKWVVNIEAMTCSYFDKAGNEILVEKIPD